MIYVCVPVHNEAATAGLVLWKVRQVFTAFEREYHLLVCNDGSRDRTPDQLASYARVLPMTVVTHRERQGYARSLEELLRLALQRTDHPKRDCAITLHADFLHSPDVMEEMVKRLESGSDLVVAEMLQAAGSAPRLHRWVRAWTPRLLRVAGLRDAVSGYVALRLSVLRQATRVAPAKPLLTTEGWCANAELIARLAPHARRLDAVPATARYDLRQRPSRVNPWRQLGEVWRARPMIRAIHAVATAIALLVLPLRAQSDSAPAASTASAAAIPALAAAAFAFPVGERTRYQAKYGLFTVGEVVLEVGGIDTVRGVETMRLRFEIKGGALWYDLEQTMQSWVGRADFRSRRFEQHSLENKRRRDRVYDIFPDSGFYRQAGVDSTLPTVADPLDDVAFLYWVRTVPLELGKRYEYSRYFRPDRNPVIIKVVRRDRVTLAGRKWRALVVQPVIPNGRGIFADKAEAQMWISDDPQRIILAIVSTFSFGTVTMKLKEYNVPERP